jgi:hypothetical protein
MLAIMYADIDIFTKMELPSVNYQLVPISNAKVVLSQAGIGQPAKKEDKKCPEGKRKKYKESVKINLLYTFQDRTFLTKVAMVLGSKMSGRQ